MKKTLREIGAAACRGEKLGPVDFARMMRWFVGGHGYFYLPEEAEQAEWCIKRLYEGNQDKISPNLVQQFESEADRPEPVIVAIEGLDGSGKTVQAELLRDRLKEMGKRVFLMDFPQYHSFFGEEIGKLLSGEAGVSAMNLDERSMCLWYAVDRWRALRDVNLSEYDYAIFNRYTLANAAYQSARKFGGYDARFGLWIFNLEHNELGLPVPDLYFYLDTDASQSAKNVLKKGQRGYTSGLDVYESSSSLLDRCRLVYRELSQEIPGFLLEDCVATENAGLKSVRSISDMLMDLLREHDLVDM